MNTEEVITQSEEETIQCAERFSKGLRAGMVLALEGDLGAGKTTFIKGIARGLGFEAIDEVTSPTFALMNIYEAETPVYHFDLYRMENPEDVFNIGFEEFVDDKRAVSCIEWPEKSMGFLPKHALLIKLEVISGNTHKIILPKL